MNCNIGLLVSNIVTFHPLKWIFKNFLSGVFDNQLTVVTFDPCITVNLDLKRIKYPKLD